MSATPPPWRPGATVQARKVGPASSPRQGSADFSYSVLDDAERGAAAGERRGFTRQRTKLRSGKVVHPGGQLITECLIRNRSAAGCRLRLPVRVALPPSIHFFDDQAGRLFHAVVMWQKDRDIGIRLLPSGPNGTSRAMAGRLQRKPYAPRR